MSVNQRNPLIILTGPTAIGKTALSIELAQAVNGEIISADSMQVYRHMDIGSAKIKPEQMQGIPHHMINILEPTEEFNVTIFQKYAKQYIEEIYSRGKIPVLTGGTGFYIQSVLYAIDFTSQETDITYRQELERLAAEKGSGYLHEMLRLADPKSAEAIHPNNVKRMIRALEYYKLEKRPISEHNAAEKSKDSVYDSFYFVLNEARERLYEQVDRRVDQMLADGLEEEVRRLLAMGCRRESTAMQGLGYKEMIAYLNGEISLEQAVYLIKRDTRHFAKRQLTWFRREKEVIWLEKEQYGYEQSKILQAILDYPGLKNTLDCFSQT